MKLTKYHALGNDYIVLDDPPRVASLTEYQIRRVCHRNFGIGSDGILARVVPNADEDFELIIFNPDGSRAEKSGNGLRIFSRYLFDEGLVASDPFTVRTEGGRVVCHVKRPDEIVVDMGQVSFHSRDIPVTGPDREVLQEPITIGGEDYEYSAATIGNPHCVVFREQVSESEARTVGPALETDSRFPRRTNVQFAQVIDRGHLRIEIWERGAGYTLASGSSSSAVARRLGWIDAEVFVEMPGGVLRIEMDEDYSIRMTGPATKIATCEVDEDMWS